MREVRNKKKARSHHQQVTMDRHRQRQRERERERERERQERDRIYERERAYLERERTYQRRPPAHHERPPPPHHDHRYRDPAPVEYMDDMGNHYYQGRHDREYGYGYRDELPRAGEQMEYLDDPDMVLYAPRYMRHIEGERDRRPDAGRPDMMNDYHRREDVDLYRAGGGYGDLTRNLGYFP